MENQRGKEPSRSFLELLALIERLRSPQGGCPWDIRQSKSDVGKYLIEEAYEAIDAIEYGCASDLQEELGDLIFQALFLASIAEEKGEFSTAEMLDSIREKMVRRHPHVFGDVVVGSIGEIKANWEEIKKGEGRKKGDGLLERVPRSLPPLLRAQKVTAEAAKVGFDWKHVGGILEKIEEEIAEFKTALDRGKKEDCEREIGDILLSVVNLARFMEISAENALRASVGKFVDRFSYIEKKLRERGKSLRESNLEEMDAFWDESKLRES